jgi:hypothetical protein
MLDLTQFSFFVFFLNPIPRNVKTNSLIFSQGIIQGDTLRGSDWDAHVMFEGVCDTHLTLVFCIHV